MKPSDIALKHSPNVADFERVVANETLVGPKTLPASTLRALHQLAVLISGVLDPQRLSGLVTSEARLLLGADTAILRLWDEAVGGLRLADRDSLDAQGWLEVQAAGVGLSGVAYLERRPVVVERYAGWDAGIEEAYRHYTQSGIAVPLLVNDRAVGTLAILSSRPRRFRRREEQILELLAAQVAPALEAARLHAESERRRAEAEVLAELARRGAACRETQPVVDLVCVQACELLHAGFAALQLRVDGHAMWLGVSGSRSTMWQQRRALGKGPASRSWAENRTLVYTNHGAGDGSLQGLEILNAEGAATVLAVPLRSRLGPFGSLLIGWRDSVTITTVQRQLGEALAGHAATILDNARAYDESERRAAQAQVLAAETKALADSLRLREEVLSGLHEVAVASGGLLDFAALGALVVDSAKDLLHGDSAGLYWWEEAAGELVRIGENDSTHRTHDVVPPVGKSVARLAYDQNTAIIVDDYPAWLGADASAVTRGLKSALAVPLRLQARAVGTLVARSYKPCGFTAEHQHILELLAAQVTPALEAARLHTESERRRAEAEALAELVRRGAMVHDLERAIRLVCEQGRYLVGADYATVALAEEGRRVWYGLSSHEDTTVVPTRGAGTGLTSRALATGQPIIEHLADRPDPPLLHTQEGGRTALAVPLTGREGLAGALHFGWRTDTEPSASQVRVAEALAGYATVILENSRAHATLAERAANIAAAQERLETLYGSLACGVLVWDDCMTVQHVNAAAEEILGRPAAEILGRKSDEFWVSVAADGSELPPEERPSRLVHATGKAVRKVLARLTRPMGDVRWLQLDVVPIRRRGRLVNETMASFIDISARKEAEAALQRQALHDGLTGLPNRVLVNDRLRQAILAARRGDQEVTLMFMDLNRFKEVNDTFGHDCGDSLLRQVGRRVSRVLRDADTLGRLGGDEFAIILPGTGLAEASKMARRVSNVVQRPITIQGRSIDVRASIGIACFPNHGHDALTLMRLADVAMYTAKRRGDGCALYEADDDPNLSGRVTLSAELRRAIGGGELELWYQPKVNCISGTGARAEALVRWQHPERGLLLPDEFIPLAEETGLIKPLTEWVVREAARQCHEWHTAGLNVSVAVNVSAHNLQDPGFPSIIEEVLRRWRLKPRWLRLEITESVLMADAPELVLKRLTSLGVPLSVDDFGTGYSSLLSLRDLPIDEMKIDKSFTLGVTSNDKDRTIVQSIIDLAHNLSKRVVAEGVETRQTWDWLVRAGCDAAQGYYLGAAMPPSGFEHWVRTFGLRVSPNRPVRLRRRALAIT